MTIRLVFVSFQSFLWHQGNNWILFSHISQSEGRLPSEIQINGSTAAISQKLQIEKSFYLFILSPSLLREMEENIVPHPVSFLTAVFQPVELWNSFYMTFPLIYIEHVTRIFFFDQSNNFPTPTCLLVNIHNCHLSWNYRFIATPP